MKKFISIMETSITKVKYIAVLAAAISAALAAFHLEMDKGLGKAKEGEVNE